MVKMKELSGLILTGERAAYASKDTKFINCTFDDGESPLKESRNIIIDNCSFKWKYPLWYCVSVEVYNSTWYEMGRSGIWYTKNISIYNSLINSPKQFRYSSDIKLIDCKLPLADETMWKCDNIELRNVYIKGDYFGMNCRNIILDNVTIDGNYCFDGGCNIKAKNCVFNSKDSFWNCDNVVIENSKIVGEYACWNTKSITFINCEIDSTQGFCYMDNIKLIGCKLYNTNLSFELCSNIDAEVITTIESIKNPINGIIRCKGYNELILDSNIINPKNTIIEVN